jgi:hypothetical protein
MIINLSERKKDVATSGEYRNTSKSELLGGRFHTADAVLDFITRSRSTTDRSKGLSLMLHHVIGRL